jgi:hypothetical protein
MTVEPPVASGQNYLVSSVGGHSPAALADFVGATEITLLKDGQVHLLIGGGARVSATVRFHQKDPGPDAKDVRVWTITDEGAGNFVAVPCARF